MVLMRRQQPAKNANVSIGYGDESAMYNGIGDEFNPSQRRISTRHQKPIIRSSSVPSSVSTSSAYQPPQRQQSYSAYESSSSCSFSQRAEDYIESPNPYGDTGNKKSTKFKNMKGSALLILNFVAISFLGYLSFKSTSQLRATTNEFKSLKIDFQDLQELLEFTEGELDSAHQDFHELQLNLLTNQGMRAKSNPASMTSAKRTEIAENILEKDDAQFERITKLQQSIQSLHQHELLRRFGEGPYHAEFAVNIQGSRRYFTVQMSSDMPHSVYYFLDMIEDGLWDNTVFAHKWTHILQSVPIGPGGRNKRESMQSTLAFPEYSEKFKHDKYTLGFAGRPGGPDFYINLLDNDDSHGPGKQPHSRVLNDADPCFAKVIIGTEVIDELQRVSDEANTKKKDEKDAVVFSTIEYVKRIKLNLPSGHSLN